jgi:hypothetical protein
VKVSRLKSAIEKLGGTARIYEATKERPNAHLSGELNGYDVNMWFSDYGRESDWFTVRLISRRGEYDMGADYNPGGFTFLRRIKDLEEYTK